VLLYHETIRGMNNLKERSGLHIALHVANTASDKHVKTHNKRDESNCHVNKVNIIGTQPEVCTLISNVRHLFYAASALLCERPARIPGNSQ
jgi:hypothetical protein